MRLYICNLYISNILSNITHFQLINSLLISLIHISYISCALCLRRVHFAHVQLHLTHIDLCLSVHPHLRLLHLLLVVHPSIHRVVKRVHEVLIIPPVHPVVIIIILLLLLHEQILLLLLLLLLLRLPNSILTLHIEHHFVFLTIDIDPRICIHIFSAAFMGIIGVVHVVLLERGYACFHRFAVDEFAVHFADGSLRLFLRAELDEAVALADLGGGVDDYFGADDAFVYLAEVIREQRFIDVRVQLTHVYRKLVWRCARFRR